MLTKLDKRFGGVKNLELLEVEWQRNGDGVVEERAETTDREAVAVAVVLVSILGVGHSCYFSCACVCWPFEVVGGLVF